MILLKSFYPSTYSLLSVFKSLQIFKRQSQGMHSMPHLTPSQVRLFLVLRVSRQLFFLVSLVLFLLLCALRVLLIYDVYLQT